MSEPPEPEIIDDQSCYLINQTHARQILKDVMASLKILGATITVSLVDDARIQRLNRQYRQIDRPTDVLAFYYQTGSLPELRRLIAERNDDPDQPPVVLGDIVISAETIRRREREDGRDPARELALLLIHGALHLVGYDHHQDDDHERMRQLERRLHDDVNPDWLANLIEEK